MKKMIFSLLLSLVVCVMHPAANEFENKKVSIKSIEDFEAFNKSMVLITIIHTIPTHNINESKTWGYIKREDNFYLFKEIKSTDATGLSEFSPIKKATVCNITGHITKTSLFLSLNSKDTIMITGLPRLNESSD